MKFLQLFLFITFSITAQNENSSTKQKTKYASNGVIINSYNYNALESFLQKNDNKTYIINFWATWCLPCVKELPYFESINSNYKTKNVEVILVSLDMSSKIESVLIPFLLKKKIQSQVLHLNDPDANTWIEKIDKNWSGAIPFTIIYNTNQKKFYEQSFTYSELENELKSFIN
jgi:thiol-disulfide isomerase/thioredoxin